MAAWKYIKGGESDFEGAPEWATHRMFNCQGAGTANKDNQAFTNGAKEGSKWVCTIDKTLTNEIKKPDEWHLIAQRKRVTSINDDRLAQDMGLNPKYNRPCKGVTIDVYDVLQAFNVTNPALQHLVKKALAVGQRGHKDKMEDLRDILASAQRAIELEEGEGK